MQGSLLLRVATFFIAFVTLSKFAVSQETEDNLGESQGVEPSVQEAEATSQAQENLEAEAERSAQEAEAEAEAEAERQAQKAEAERQAQEAERTKEAEAQKAEAERTKKAEAQKAEAERKAQEAEATRRAALNAQDAEERQQKEKAEAARQAAVAAEQAEKRRKDATQSLKDVTYLEDKPKSPSALMQAASIADSAGIEKIHLTGAISVAQKQAAADLQKALADKTDVLRFVHQVNGALAEARSAKIPDIEINAAVKAMQTELQQRLLASTQAMKFTRDVAVFSEFAKIAKAIKKVKSLYQAPDDLKDAVALFNEKAEALLLEDPEKNSALMEIAESIEGGKLDERSKRLVQVITKLNHHKDSVSVSALLDAVAEANGAQLPSSLTGPLSAFADVQAKAKNLSTAELRTLSGGASALTLSGGATGRLDLDRLIPLLAKMSAAGITGFEVDAVATRVKEQATADIKAAMDPNKSILEQVLQCKSACNVALSAGVATAVVDAAKSDLHAAVEKRLLAAKQGLNEYLLTGKAFEELALTAQAWKKCGLAPDRYQEAQEIYRTYAEKILQTNKLDILADVIQHNQIMGANLNPKLLDWHKTQNKILSMNLDNADVWSLLDAMASAQQSGFPVTNGSSPLQTTAVALVKEAIIAARKPDSSTYAPEYDLEKLVPLLAKMQGAGLGDSPDYVTTSTVAKTQALATLKAALASKEPILAKSYKVLNEKQAAERAGVNAVEIQAVRSELVKEIQQGLDTAKLALSSNLSRTEESYREISDVLLCARKQKVEGAEQVQEVFLQHLQGRFDKKDLANLDVAYDAAQRTGYSMQLSESLHSWKRDMDMLREAQSESIGQKNLEKYIGALTRVKDTGCLVGCLNGVPSSLDVMSIQTALRNSAHEHLKETQIGNKKNLLEAAIAEAVSAGVPEYEIASARKLLAVSGATASVMRADL
jgi:hypothetical protein